MNFTFSKISSKTRPLVADVMAVNGAQDLNCASQMNIDYKITALIYRVETQIFCQITNSGVYDSLEI
jgi:hypothetical protein